MVPKQFVRFEQLEHLYVRFLSKGDISNIFEEILETFKGFSDPDGFVKSCSDVENDDFGFISESKLCEMAE